jgi:tetratricopeptide (TPR) repeat protein
MTAKGVLWTLVILVLMPLHAWAESPYKSVERGNELYAVEEFDAAGQHYASAGVVFPEAAEIFFNQGNVLYKQRKFLQALAYYTSALQTVEGVLESRVKYNLGNVEYRRALIAMSAPQDSMLLLRSAITYYRDSLAIDPQQQHARYNLELAHRLLHQLYEELQQDRRDNADDGRNSDRKSENDESQQRKSEQRNSRKNKQEDEGQAGSEASQSVMADSGMEETPEDMEMPDDLSLEEAEMRLDEIRDRARKVSEMRQEWRKARMRDGKVEKYW